MTTTSTETPPVALRGVSRRYRTAGQTIVAVNNVSLELHPGHLDALVGPSGSGKSTLINLIIGAEQPDNGSVVFRDDISVAWDSIAFIPQALGLMHELTVGENIALPSRLARQATPVSGDLLDGLELAGLIDRFPSEISLGEQQRAAIARALTLRPTVLIADEPTAHQDEKRAAAVMSMLSGLTRRGSAVLIATHERRILNQATRVFTMLDGELR